MKAIVDAIYAGAVRPMPDDGRPTGIFKTPLAGEAEIGREGLVGDAQADRRVHGGPEKALHHFPAEHYARFAAAFTEQAAAFVPGAIGENLTTRGWTEAEVCLGDVYTFGSARLQLSQPRSPCWKIDARFGVDGLTRYVAEHGIAGWYYRVLAPGRCRAGDALELIEREPDPVTLAEYWRLRASPRADRARLQRVADSPGLAPEQRARWQQRLDWLRAQR
ncbi:MOSC domain-containing protein [Solimonas flava]|uniref:MOSC domain-containing protein n=1 Tax=Solimonas flava TaxID=415849 RepID=UPI000403DDD7|nr:MOSC domain-containing protein [Solimonas flava]